MFWLKVIWCAVFIAGINLNFVINSFIDDVSVEYLTKTSGGKNAIFEERAQMLQPSYLFLTGFGGNETPVQRQTEDFVRSGQVGSFENLCVGSDGLRLKHSRDRLEDNAGT